MRRGVSFSSFQFPSVKDEDGLGLADPLQDPLQGQALPGLRQRPPQGARRQTQPDHLPAWRLHLQEGRYRAGDVHRKVWVCPGD